MSDLYFSDGETEGLPRQPALHDDAEEEMLMRAIAMSLKLEEQEEQPSSEAGLPLIRNMIDQEIVVWFVLFILSYFPGETEEEMLMRAIAMSLEEEPAFETGLKGKLKKWQARKSETLFLLWSGFSISKSIEKDTGVPL